MTDAKIGEWLNNYLREAQASSSSAELVAEISAEIDVPPTTRSDTKPMSDAEIGAWLKNPDGR